MQHLNTPPRPISTASAPRSSAAGSVWAWLVLVTSGRTCQSTPSQETAPSTEVSPVRSDTQAATGGHLCRQIYTMYHFFSFADFFFFFCQFWIRTQRKVVTPQRLPGRFSRLSVKGTTMSYWQDLCPHWPFTCAHCGRLSSSNSWLLVLARSKNLKMSDQRSSRATITTAAFKVEKGKNWPFK